ncbi:hypothetical protein LBMAG20_09140 [Methylocystaceae bacterium]|nr:hypothetical protein LBMAG20_09140 [Methylocystaceae bacterium]
MNREIVLMIEKLERIEVIIMHHDKIIGEMNEVILSQWKKIDAAEKKLAQLNEELNCMNRSQESRDQRPPHY